MRLVIPPRQRYFHRDGPENGNHCFGALFLSTAIGPMADLARRAIDRFFASPRFFLARRPMDERSGDDAR